MTFQRDVAKTAARKWFNENNEIITYEKTNCVGNSDYAIFIAGRNHYSPKDKPKESANIKTDEILNFESQLPDTVKNYHGIIARTYTHNETWVKEWCYIVEIPNVHLKKQAEKGGFSINEGGSHKERYIFILMKKVVVITNGGLITGILTPIHQNIFVLIQRIKTLGAFLQF